MVYLTSEVIKLLCKGMTIVAGYGGGPNMFLGTCNGGGVWTGKYDRFRGGVQKMSSIFLVNHHLRSGRML